MQLRIPAPFKKRPGAQILSTALAAVFCLLSATAAKATLVGTYNTTSSTTGSVAFSGAPGPGPFTVGGAGPAFCIDGDGCVTSGLFGSVSVTGTMVAFTFFGSTVGENGSFTINLTNLNNAITGVTLASGSLIDGMFGLSGSTAHSISFTGSTTTLFNGVGGRTVVFDVTSVPEPSSVVLLLTIFAGLIIVARRRMAPSGGTGA
jgi:hypothetical protein